MSTRRWLGRVTALSLLAVVGTAHAGGMCPVHVSSGVFTDVVERVVPVPPGATEILGWGATWGLDPAARFLEIRWFHDAGARHLLDDKAFSPGLVGPGGTAWAGYNSPLWKRGEGHPVAGTVPPRVWVRVKCTPASPERYCLAQIVVWFDIAGPAACPPTQ